MDYLEWYDRWAVELNNEIKEDPTIIDDEGYIEQRFHEDDNIIIEPSSQTH